MLLVENITKIYPKGQIKANNDISFSLETGQMVWISGATGSGKTTLLNVLAAIDDANSGNVIWDDKNITMMNNTEKADFRLHKMGLVFQALELIKAQDAFNNVALPLRFAQVPEAQVKIAVEEIFNYLEIEFLIKKFPQEMSGGQQQRVALARSLVHKPHFILGDEISSALDSHTAHFIYEKIRKYVKDTSSLALLISHDPTIGDYVDKRFNMIDGILEEVK